MRSERNKIIGVKIKIRLYLLSSPAYRKDTSDIIKDTIPIKNNLNLKFVYSELSFDFNIKKHAINANKGKYKGK